MIRATTHSDGSVTVEAQLEQQPAIYCDHDSLTHFARTEADRERFLAAFQRRGTLMFSWSNAFDLSGPQGDTARLIREFLDAIGPRWIPLEMNPWRVARKESGVETSSGSPCVSESFLTAYYPHVHGGKLSLATVVDLVQRDRAAVQSDLEIIKREAHEMVQKWREDYILDPASLDRNLPRVPNDATRPTSFLLRELERLVTSEARSHTWTPNDGLDFMHATVAGANADLVLLDRQWKRRVVSVAPSRTYPWIFYRAEIREFLDTFENVTVGP